MESRMVQFIILLTITTIIIDIFSYLALRPYFKKEKKKFTYVYGSITLLILTFYIYILSQIGETQNPDMFLIFTNFNGIFFILYIPKLVISIFYLLTCLFKGILFLIEKLNRRKNIKPTNNGGISRLQFITKIGIITSILPFISLLYGWVEGRFNLEVIRKKIQFKNLPSHFHSLKIVQISDLHIGYFKNHKEHIRDIVSAINQLNPDLLFFTGDLVNNFADELIGFEKILKELKATTGKFSILGNHDYGEYTVWNSIEKKQQNFEKIKNFHKKIGFKLLLNENHMITKGNQNINIIGVENWGEPPFSQYANLEKAMENIHLDSFKILLTHNPTHWEEEVVNKTNIDMALSGHTHGMQIGLNYKNFIWSLAKLKYKYWTGLYNEKNQYLYVNRGLGYVGIPIRIGMSPEITLFELLKKN